MSDHATDVTRHGYPQIKAPWELALEEDELAPRDPDGFDASYLRECRNLWKTQAESLWEALQEEQHERNRLKAIVEYLESKLFVAGSSPAAPPMKEQGDA